MISRIISEEDLEKLFQTEEAFKTELKVDENDLPKEALEQPARYAYWAVRAVLAEGKVEELELVKKLRFAQLYQKFSLELAASNKRVTEAAIEGQINQDESWITLQQEIWKWGSLAKIAREVVNSFRQRSQMIWAAGLMRKGENEEVKYMGNS